MLKHFKLLRNFSMYQKLKYCNKSMHKQKHQQQYKVLTLISRSSPSVSTPCHSKWKSKGLPLALDCTSTTSTRRNTQWWFSQLLEASQMFLPNKTKFVGGLLPSTGECDFLQLTCCAGSPLGLSTREPWQGTALGAHETSTSRTTAGHCRQGA